MGLIMVDSTALAVGILRVRFSLGFYGFSVGFCGVYVGILWEIHAPKEINKASNKTHP